MGKRAILRPAPLTRQFVYLLGVLAACGDAEPEPRARPEPGGWLTLVDDAPGALLRVMGSEALGVYAVGADADGQGPLVYRIDDGKPTRLETGVHGSLWWCESVSPEELQMVGDHGLVLRYRPGQDGFMKLNVPTEMRLFGVWSAPERETWYVGGDLTQSVGVVLRGTQAELAPPDALAADALRGAIFKVQGYADGSVWMVGQAGRAIFFDGQSFSAQNADTPLPLLSVSGVDAGHAFAVGGAANGVILRRDGDTWVDETPAALPQMISVWATSAEHAYAVGFNGHMYERKAGTWRAFEPAPPTYKDLHSVWVDAHGGIWVAGGQLTTDPPTAGVLLHYPAPGAEAQP